MGNSGYVDPTLPQSAFPYQTGSSTPGTPTGAEQLITASGSITGKRGPYYLKAANASPMTIQIPVPISGGSAGGGDDNVELDIVNVDGLAHVIQCGAASPAAGYLNDGVNYKVTFSGSPIGRAMKLRAYGGFWFTGSGATLT